MTLRNETNQNGPRDSQDKIRIAHDVKELFGKLLQEKYPTVVKDFNGLLTRGKLLEAFNHRHPNIDERPPFPFPNKSFHEFIKPDGIGVSIPIFLGFAKELKKILQLGAEYTYGKLTADRPEQFKPLVNCVINEDPSPSVVGNETNKPTTPQREDNESPRIEVNVPPSNVVIQPRNKFSPTINVRPRIVVDTKIILPEKSRPPVVAPQDLKEHAPMFNLMTFCVFLAAILLSLCMVFGVCGEDNGLNFLISLPLIVSVTLLIGIPAIKLYHVIAAHAACTAKGEVFAKWYRYAQRLDQKMLNPKPFFDLSTPGPVRLRVARTYFNELLIWVTVILVVAIVMCVSTPFVQARGFLAAVAASLVICISIWLPVLVAYCCASVVWWCRFSKVVTTSLYLLAFTILWPTFVYFCLLFAAPQEIERSGLEAVSMFLLSPLFGFFVGNYGQSAASLICFAWAFWPMARTGVSLFGKPTRGGSGQANIRTPSEATGDADTDIDLELAREERADYMVSVFKEYFDENRIAVQLLRPVVFSVYYLGVLMNRLRRPVSND